MLFQSFEEYLKECRGAIHIGANVGEERDWYKKMGFKRVIWFEPNIDIFHILLKNIKDCPGHEAHNLGVHDTLRIAKLHIANNGGQSSSLLPLGTHKEHHPRVHYVGDQIIPLTRMDDFIRDYKIDTNEYNFLNVDVQGVELNVLKSFGMLLWMFDYLYLEVNLEELYEGCALLDEIEDYVAEFNFERKVAKITQHRWGDAFYVNKTNHETSV